MPTGAQTYGRAYQCHARYGKMEADHKDHVANVKRAIIESRIQVSVAIFFFTHWIAMLTPIPAHLVCVDGEKGFGQA